MLPKIPLNVDIETRALIRTYATGTNLGARDPEADEWKDGDDEDDANDGSFSPALYSGDDDDDEVGG